MMPSFPLLLFFEVMIRANECVTKSSMNPRTSEELMNQAVGGFVEDE
jgi:hypothetical protein